LITVKNDYDFTALHTAKDVDIARVLVQQDSDLVNMVDSSGFTIFGAISITIQFQAISKRFFILLIV
jgi:hypothetical protein